MPHGDTAINHTWPHCRLHRVVQIAIDAGQAVIMQLTQIPIPLSRTRTISTDQDIRLVFWWRFGREYESCFGQAQVIPQTVGIPILDILYLLAGFS